MGRAGRLESIRSGDWRYYWIGGPDSLTRKINKLKITAFVCHLTSLGDFTTSYIVVVNSSWFYFWTRWSWLVISRAIAKKDVYDSYSHWTPCLVLWSLVSLTSLPLVRVLLGLVGCLVFFVSFLCFAPGCSFFFLVVGTDGFLLFLSDLFLGILFGLKLFQPYFVIGRIVAALAA